MMQFLLQVDLNQAINMVTYYASSSEPAQIRGKTVYIQYSNRHEIVNNRSPGDVPGNVLLVTIEGVEAGDVSIDVIHLVMPVLLCRTNGIIYHLFCPFEGRSEKWVLGCTINTSMVFYVDE